MDKSRVWERLAQRRYLELFSHHARRRRKQTSPPPLTYFCARTNSSSTPPPKTLLRVTPRKKGFKVVFGNKQRFVVHRFLSFFVKMFRVFCVCVFCVFFSGGGFFLNNQKGPSFLPLVGHKKQGDFEAKLSPHKKATDRRLSLSLQYYYSCRRPHHGASSDKGDSSSARTTPPRSSSDRKKS